VYATLRASRFLEDEMGRRRDLAPREAAEFLGVHTNTLRRWSDMGLLESHRIGNRGHRRFRYKDLVAYLDRVSR
jgi:excisionase family DNA binding protein